VYRKRGSSFADNLNTGWPAVIVPLSVGQQGLIYVGRATYVIVKRQHLPPSAPHHTGGRAADIAQVHVSIQVFARSCATCYAIKRM